MINKIKDFLKNKLSRKGTDDLYDQDELLDQEIPDDDLDEGLRTAEQFDQDEETFDQENSDEDDQHETLPEETKPSWKDKFKITLPHLTRTKKNIELSEDDQEEEVEPPEVTSAIQFDKEDKISFKDKLATSLIALRSKLNRNTSQWKTPSAVKSKNAKEVVLLSPSLSQGIEKFLSREARNTIHQVSLVFIICAVTYTLGKVTALVLRGAPVVDSARDFTISINIDEEFNPSTLAQVKNINIFRTNTGLGTKKKAAPIRCDVAQQTSNLPIKVFNTVVLQDTVKSLASVQVRGDRDLQEVRTGDQISNLAKIFKIDRLEILIRNLETGVCESIASDKALEGASPISVMSPSQSRSFIANKKVPGIENKGNKFEIKKSVIDEKMKDIASVLTQARAIKVQNPDGTIAFKLTEIDPEGIFPALGIQDQDIITSINGKPIYDMNEVMGLFSKIKNLDKLQLGIKREGSDSTQEYSIKK